MNISKKIVISVSQLFSNALILGTRFLYRKSYKNLYNSIRRVNPIIGNINAEKNYISKWKKLDKNPDKNTFRLFSMYIGENPNIVPEDISASIIQPLLNPIDTRPYYQDKNMFEKILPLGFVPKAILRKIQSEYYDVNYNPTIVNDEYLDGLGISTDRIFIKPSIDSSSGKGVICFKRDSYGTFFSSNGIKFNASFLDDYSKKHTDFIIQEGLSQSKFISQFNPTSINTIRIATYRSVKDNKVHVCAIILRIGKTGAEVDNAHAGGLFVGIDKDGTLGKYACDQDGNTFTEFNNIDFANGSYKIPDFKKVLDFAVMVGQKIPHHRLIAQDIAIQANGEPCLVEFNIRAFSVWLFQFTSGPAFGNFTDEIIEYCANHKSEIRKVLVEPF